MRVKRIEPEAQGAEWIKAYRKAASSAMAQMVQSYELKIMMAMLPILQAEHSIRVLSWLHDGMTLHFGAQYERDRQIKRLKRTVKEEAERMGIKTELEVNQLRARPRKTRGRGARRTGAENEASRQIRAAKISTHEKSPDSRGNTNQAVTKQLQNLLCFARFSLWQVVLDDFQSQKGANLLEELEPGW